MAAYSSGKPRGSGRPWRVRAYGPSRGFPQGRVGLRPVAADGTRRDLNALAGRYYEWLKINDRDPGYVNSPR